MSVVQRLYLAVFICSFAIVPLSPDTSRAGFLQTYQATGNLQMEVTGAAGLGLPATGMLTLTSTPTGTIKQAYLYATQTNNTLGLSATFAGSPLGVVGPYANEALLITLSTYRWDVTANIVPGVGSYSFSILDGMGNPVAVAGVGLVVVWENAAEPTRTVTIVDGVKQVGESGAETESMMFSALPAGMTTVWVFVTDDDAMTMNESVSYNAAAIGGPLVANLGLNASVLKMTGTSVLGANTLSISTQSDHLTWVLGATAVDQPVVPTTESTWGRIKGLYR